MSENTTYFTSIKDILREVSYRLDGVVPFEQADFYRQKSEAVMEALDKLQKTYVDTVDENLKLYRRIAELELRNSALDRQFNAGTQTTNSALNQLQRANHILFELGYVMRQTGEYVPPPIAQDTLRGDNPVGVTLPGHTDDCSQFVLEQLILPAACLHPERLEGEVFLTNTSADTSVFISSTVYQTYRFGTHAYDVDNRLVCFLVPVFVQIQELKEKYTQDELKSMFGTDFISINNN